MHAIAPHPRLRDTYVLLVRHTASACGYSASVAGVRSFRRERIPSSSLARDARDRALSPLRERERERERERDAGVSCWERGQIGVLCGLSGCCCDTGSFDCPVRVLTLHRHDHALGSPPAVGRHTMRLAKSGIRDTLPLHQDGGISAFTSHIIGSFFGARAGREHAMAHQPRVSWANRMVSVPLFLFLSRKQDNVRNKDPTANARAAVFVSSSSFWRSWTQDDDDDDDAEVRARRRSRPTARSSPAPSTKKPRASSRSGTSTSSMTIMTHPRRLRRSHEATPLPSSSREPKHVSGFDSSSRRRPTHRTVCLCKYKWPDSASLQIN